MFWMNDRPLFIPSSHRLPSCFCYCVYIKIARARGVITARVRQRESGLSLIAQDPSATRKIVTSLAYDCSELDISVAGWCTTFYWKRVGMNGWEASQRRGDAPPSPERFRGKGKEITRFASNHAINGLPLRAVMQGQNRLQRITASQKNTIRSSWRNGQRDEMTPLQMIASLACCSVSRHDGL